MYMHIYIYIIIYKPMLIHPYFPSNHRHLHRCPQKNGPSAKIHPAELRSVDPPGLHPRDMIGICLEICQKSTVHINMYIYCAYIYIYDSICTCV